MRKLLTVNEAAEALRVRPATIREWLKRGVMHGYKLPDDRWRVPEIEVERILGEKEEVEKCVT